MTFAESQWLWAFVLFPVLLALAFASARRRQELIAKLVAARLAPKLAGGVSMGRRWLRFFLLLLGLAGAILALARPQWGYTWEQSKRKGRDVIFVIDTSRSMLADDIKPNRLTRAKLAAQDLIAGLTGDRIGIIAFAGTAFLQAPLTVDYGAVLNSLKELDTEIIPQGGTNLESALRAARDAFGKGESENRAIVIFSDGEELDANAEKVAEELKNQVRIFAVGVGTPEGALIPVRSRGGGTEFVKDEAGNVVRSKLDETRLRTIAEATGGFYLHLQTGRAEMQQIARDGLGAMTEKDIDARLSRHPIERFQWPLGGGIALLMLGMLIGERRRSALLRTTTLAAALLLPSMGQAKNTGVEAYDDKDYERAQQEFSKQLGRRPNLPELEFDLGGAAYKKGDYDTAMGAFSRAMTTENPQLRTKAAFNLGNTLFKRGAAQQEKEAKITEWKNALQQYDQALQVDPKNQDAAYNRDIVRKLIEDLEKEPPKQDDQQKQDKQDNKDKDKQDNKDKDKQDQQKQQDQKQDQQKDQQQKQDQQQKDQQQQQKQQQNQKNQQQEEKSGQGSQEQKQGSDQKDSKDQQGQQGQQKDQKDQSKDQQGQQQSADKQPAQQGENAQPQQPGNEGKESQPPPPQPGDQKKEGELKAAQQGEPGNDEKSQAAEALAEAQAAKDGTMTQQQARALLESLKGEDQKVRLADPRERSGIKRTLKDW